MFKAFVFSDPHIGNSLPHAVMGDDGVTDRLLDSCDALTWVLDEAAARNLEVYCLGDFFDERLVDSVTMKMIGRALSKRGRVNVIPGNHDASDQTNRHFSPEGVHEFGGGLRALEACADEKWIATLPYCDLAEVSKWMANAKCTKSKLLMAHLEVVGFGHGGGWACPKGIDEKELGKWGAVLTGHFHAYQPFSSTQGCYTGALRQLDFSDEGKKQGAWVVSWDGETLDMEFVVYPDGPTFYTVDIPATELMNAEYLEFPDCMYLKIRASGSVDELRAVPKTEIRAAAMELGIRRVIFDDRPEYHHTKKRMDVEPGMSLVEMVSKYVQSSAVNIGSMDPTRLTEVGRRAVNEARARMKGGS